MSVVMLLNVSSSLSLLYSVFFWLLFLYVQRLVCIVFFCSFCWFCYFFWCFYFCGVFCFFSLLGCYYYYIFVAFYIPPAIIILVISSSFMRF